MRLRRTAMTLACLTLAGTALAQDLERATPESVGFSSTGLERATGALQAHIDAGHIAGVVAAVARNGKLVYLEALGQRDLAASDPMPDDALFRLYSMTRSITSAAVMVLWEEGAFQLDDPISMYLPQFANQRVFLDAREPDMSRTRARNADITVRHLLTHTSGIGSRSSPIYRAERVRLRSITLPQMVDNAARVPLFEDPGTRFRYGISTTMLGRLVEIWSGQPFEEFLAERVLEPLRMTDTVFWADGERADRLTTVYRPDRDKRRAAAPRHRGRTVHRASDVDRGRGRVAVVDDGFSAIFSGLFEQRGNWTVPGCCVQRRWRLMTRNHIPDSVLPIGTRGYMAGSGWGLGFNVVLDSSAYPFPVGEGEYWWDGSSGTRFSIDPEQGIVTVVMAAVSPSGGGGFREEFKTLVYDAMIDER